MVLIFDGDCFDPLRLIDEWDENFVIPLDEFSLNLGKTIWAKIYLWQNKYSIYTPLTPKELKSHLQEAEKLDKEGVLLLEEISRATFKIDSRVIKAKYFSLCFDRILHVIEK